MSLRPSANNEYVPRTHAAVEAPVDEHPVNQPAQAERSRNQADGDQHNAAGNILGMDEIERSSEEQTSGKTGLHAHPLLMKIAGQARRGIEMKPPADDNQRDRKSAKKRQQNSHRSPMNERAAPESLCAVHRPGMKLIKRREDRSSQDSNSIQNHPQLCCAPGAAHRTRHCATRPFRRRRY